MARKIRFSVVDGDKTLGHATLSDEGELTFDTPAVEQIMTPMRNRVGDKNAFELYADWSNGYVSGKELKSDAKPVAAHGGGHGTLDFDEVGTPADPDFATGPQATVPLWRGLIGPFDVMSGDKRMLVAGDGSTWSTRPLPLPVSYQREDQMGHDGAVTVGRIMSAQVGKDGFAAAGDWLESVPETGEAMSLLEKKVLYPSVDLDDVTFEFRTPDGTQSIDEMTDDEFEEMMMSGEEPVMAVTGGRLTKVTFLAAQAFPQTTLELYQGQPFAEPVAASASGNTSLPVADRGRSWDGSGAESRVLAWAKGDSDQADPSKLRQAYFYRDDAADPHLQAAYKLPFADVINGTLTMVYSGVSSAAGRLNQTQMPDSDKPAVKSKIEAAYRTCSKAFDDPDVKAPWLAAIEEALTAGGPGRVVGPVYPPEAWFADPQLTELTPITVTADGRVFGHLADRDCHMSYLGGGQCILPPEEGSFEWFHRGEIETAEHTLIACGLITASTGHPVLEMGSAEAVRHYDDTGTQVAVIRAGRDRFGTWAAGSVVPEATDAMVQLLRRSPISGDWRVIGGKRQLIAALAVNVPGFPVVRGRQSAGRVVAMVSSGWAGWHTSDPKGPKRTKTQLAIAAEVERILTERAEHARVVAEAENVAASIGRDMKSQVAALDLLVHERA